MVLKDLPPGVTLPEIERQAAGEDAYERLFAEFFNWLSDGMRAKFEEFEDEYHDPYIAYEMMDEFYMFLKEKQNKGEDW